MFRIGMIVRDLDRYIVGTVVCHQAGDNTEAESVTIRWNHGYLETIVFDENEERSWEDFEDVTPKTFVNVYIRDRAYGGPEEGGWWYDTCYPIEEDCQQYRTKQRALTAYEEMKKKYDEENEGRPPISSVISRGIYEVRLEAYPAEGWPKSRPHYE